MYVFAPRQGTGASRIRKWAVEVQKDANAALSPCVVAACSWVHRFRIRGVETVLHALPLQTGVSVLVGRSRLEIAFTTGV